MGFLTQGEKRISLSIGIRLDRCLISDENGISLSMGIRLGG
jgi:hypothetical protein